jgi:transcriptional repressor NrdR
MHCPFCRNPDSRVVDSREADEGQAIRRRRSCPECGRRFTTVETAVLAVVKRSGVTEPFSREKVISGVRRACQGRQVDDDALNLLAQQVEDTVRAGGSPEVPSNEVGLAILGPLRSRRCVPTARCPRPADGHRPGLGCRHAARAAPEPSRIGAVDRYLARPRFR